MNRSWTTTIFALALPAALPAQDYGNLLMQGGIGIAHQNLAFAFPFPGSAPQNHIHIDSLGRVTAQSAGTHLSYDSSVFLNGPASLNPYWNDISIGGGNNGGVYFHDFGNLAIVTWHDVKLGPNGSRFTFQCQLFDDGRFRYVYDDRVPVGAITFAGHSPGNGATDPGNVDFSTGVDSGSESTVYEHFFLFNWFDLAGQAAMFTPNAQGGYAVSTEPSELLSVASASVAPVAEGELGPVLTFTPDGLGGYDVSFTGEFDDTYESNGTWTYMGDDHTLDYQLPFAFTMPGGTVTNDIRVDSNGRLTVPSANQPSAYDINMQHVRAAPSPSILMWADLDPWAAGRVYHRAYSDRYDITWHEVPVRTEWLSDNTFQIQLHADGRIVFAMHDLSDWGTNWIVGLTEGFGAADPGEVDYSDEPSSNGNPTIYEHFWPITDFVRRHTQPTLNVSGTPTPGGSFTAQVSPAGASGAWYMIGDPAIYDLGPLGGEFVGFRLLVDLPTATAIPGAGGAPLQFQVPNSAFLHGFTFDMQGLTVDLSQPLNPLGIRVTDSVRMTIGG